MAPICTRIMQQKSAIASEAYFWCKILDFCTILSCAALVSLVSTVRQRKAVTDYRLSATRSLMPGDAIGNEPLVRLHPKTNMLVVPLRCTEECVSVVAALALRSVKGAGRETGRCLQHIELSGPAV